MPPVVIVTPIPVPTPPVGFEVVGYDLEPDAGEGFDLIAYAVRGDEWRVAVWGRSRQGEWGPWRG